MFAPNLGQNRRITQNHYKHENPIKFPSFSEFAKIEGKISSFMVGVTICISVFFYDFPIPSIPRQSGKKYGGDLLSYTLNVGFTRFIKSTMIL